MKKVKVYANGKVLIDGFQKFQIVFEPDGRKIMYECDGICTGKEAGDVQSVWGSKEKLEDKILEEFSKL